MTFEEVAATSERLAQKRVGRRYLPAWLLRFWRTLYQPFDETKARFIAMRRDVATSNWRVDMSEVVKQYPVRLVTLDELVGKGP